jgi:hypothetical protein
VSDYSGRWVICFFLQVRLTHSLFHRTALESSSDSVYIVSKFMVVLHRELYVFLYILVVAAFGIP